MSTNSIQAVNQCVEKFNAALSARDADALKALTAEGLSYGHSKGKVETQETFIANIISDGATQFVKIDIADQTTEIVGDNAVVRHIFKAETNKNGKAGKLEIHNVLVWAKSGNSWVLIARQAYKF